MEEKNGQQELEQEQEQRRPNELFTWLIGSVCHIYRGTLMDKRINLVKSRQARAYTHKHTHTICRMKCNVEYKNQHTHYTINDERTIVVEAKTE